MMQFPSNLHALLWVLIIFGSTSASSVEKSYNVYHLLGSGSKLTPRGTIKIAPSDDGMSSELIATFHPANSAELDVAAFDRMVESGDLYTLIVSDESSANHQVSASVPGCSVRRSNLREEITLFISPTGGLMSVSYRPLISPLAAKTCDNLMPLVDKPDAIFRNKEEGMLFKTTVAFEAHKPMIEIPTILPQSRPPPGLNWYRRNAKNNPPIFGEGGAPTEEAPQGFQATFLYKVLTKYWYIVLPLAIMGLFGEEPQGGQSRETAAARDAQQTQRRGKRN